MDSAKKRPPQNLESVNYGTDNFPDASAENEETYPPFRDGWADLAAAKKRKGTIKKIFLYGFILIIGTALAWGLYFGWKVHSVGRKIIVNNDSSLGQDIQTVISTVVSSSHKKLAGEESGRINLLLLGISGQKPGPNLTDTILIVSLDTKNNKAALLSLPRDFYASVPDTGYSSKINTIYQYGLSNDQGIGPLKKTVEEITGLAINYYAVIDFEGFKKIIDDIGGVNINVERDIYDPRYPGPNYSYETFEIKKGLHEMDGETALKYSRERHNDPDGDFGRARRQQQVIQAVKNKSFSLQTFLNVFTLNKLLNTLGNHVKTNIKLDEIGSFIDLSRKVDNRNVVTKVVDAWEKESLLKVSHIQAGSIRMFILIPRVGNYSEIHDLAKNIFDLEAIAKRRDEIAKEGAQIAIINQSGQNNLELKIRDLIKDKFEIPDVEIINSGNDITRDNSIVIDKTSGQKLFTLDELIKKLPADLSEESVIIETKKNYDFIVVLGKDLADTYKYEEDSVEDWKNSEENQEYQELLNNS